MDEQMLVWRLISCIKKYFTLFSEF